MKHVSLIETFYPSFSKQEKKVADYVIKEKKQVCFMSLSEITKKINVSESTIVRFVKKLGFKGFIEFKLEVANEISNLQNYISEDYIDNISSNIFETINKTKELIDKNDVEKVVEYINNSKRMFIFGIGASGVAALEMQNRFMRYGKIGHSVNDGHFQVMYSSVATSEDVIIVLSLSGETADLIYPLTIAKEKGAKIILITNYILSTLSKLSDVTLLTSGKETPLDGGSLIAKISQLYVIDILATGYALKNVETSQEMRNKIAKSIAKKNK